MLKSKEIEKYYSRIKCKRKIESKDEYKFAICCIHATMSNFEDELCEAMEEKTAQIKEYIEQLETNKKKLIEKLMEILKDDNFAMTSNDYDYIYGKGRYELAEEIIEKLK